jgi:nucleotide-binding universal stress UspA family protein
MYKDILLTIDMNQPSSWQKALPVAVEMCRLADGRLHVLNVVPDFESPVVAQYFPADFETRMREEAAAQLAALVGKSVPAGVKTEIHIRRGAVYREIIDAAEEIGADLIVMQSHRPELQDYLLGPNAARVVRHSNKSVLVVR